MSQNGQKPTLVLTSLKKPKTPKFFHCRLGESLEGLNSTLAKSAELCSCWDNRKMLDCSLISRYDLFVAGSQGVKDLYLRIVAPCNLFIYQIYT